MNVQPYVFFDGKCEEALEFYKGAHRRQGRHDDAFQ